MTTARLVFLVFSGVAAQQPPPPPPAPPPSVLAAHAGCPAPETVPPPPAPPNCPTMLTDYIPEETDVTNPVELTGCPFTISRLVEGTNLYFKINRTTANARVKYSWNWGAAAPPRIVFSCAPSSCPALLNCTHSSHREPSFTNRWGRPLLDITGLRASRTPTRTAPATRSEPTARATPQPMRLHPCDTLSSCASSLSLSPVGLSHTRRGLCINLLW